MKFILEINENKVAFFLEILKNFKFVKKVTPLSDSKAILIQDIQESIHELKDIKSGKIKGIPANNLLNEL